MDTQPNSSLTHSWQAQIRQVAAHNPRLARQLWQNRQMYFERFAHFYRQLSNLPRKLRHKFLKRLATTLTGAALLLALGQALPARAAVITVDGAVCTLAEAITSANNDNSAGNGCVDGSGADVIDLQTDVLLSATLPLISSEITLEGNGHILDGNNWNFRVLNLAASGNLTLNEAIITHGGALEGGGILNYGTLTVNDSTFDDNFAYAYLNGGGGINNKPGGVVTLNNSTLINNGAGGGGGLWNSGTMLVNGSTLNGNYSFAEFGSGGGGGINNRDAGTLIVTNSTLSGNFAFDGGGISNRGTLVLQNSTLSGNSVDFSGGGVLNIAGSTTLNNSTLSGNSAHYGGGGGVSNIGGTVTVNNSTLSDNLAYYGGGICNGGFWDGTVIVNNSTLSNNSATGTFTPGTGGGIFNKSGSTVSLNRSLIAGNSAPDGAEVDNEGIIRADNYNVIGFGGSARSNGFTPGPNDIIPSGALDTVLDTTLADNGGPTFTHALVSGSVAIDVAPDVDCLAPPINGIDQRGYARNVDGDGSPSSYECDTGAFEFAPSGRPTKTPTPTATPVTRTPPPTTPTRTPTARVTQAVTRTPTPTPFANVSLPVSQAESSNPLVTWAVASLFGLGNLLFFRNRKV